MSKQIIRGLAIAAGTGLAIGLGNNRNRPPADNAASAGGASEKNIPDDRLAGIESRLRALETRPPEIHDRFDRQDREIAALRVQMAETRDKVGAAMHVVESRFAEAAKDLPDLVESVMTTHVAKLRAEIQESVDATLESFEKTIDSKVTLRVATLEKALVDQSGIITALSQRALESDANLQRLISAVEKLCERTEARPAAPFEKQLDDAIKRPSGFRPAIVTEEEDLRPRRKLTRL
jgi:chromosome segregation ATPase